LLAGSHAGVKALGDDIDQAVVDDDLDLDVRILRRNFASFGQRIVSAA